MGARVVRRRPQRPDDVDRRPVDIRAAEPAEVQRVAVAETARGTGVGRALMRAVEQAALGQGLTLLWLTTHDATDACAFYEAVGYAKLGVMPSYSLRPDGTPAPAAFYFKELRGSP